MASARIADKRITLDYMTRDGHSLVYQGLATMVRVAQGDNLKLAMEAAQWLVAYGEQVCAEKRKPVEAAQQAKALGQTRAGLIEELRGLYTKALGEPLVVDATVEPEPPARRQFLFPAQPDVPGRGVVRAAHAPVLRELADQVLVQPAPNLLGKGLVFRRDLKFHSSRSAFRSPPGRLKAPPSLVARSLLLSPGDAAPSSSLTPGEQPGPGARRAGPGGNRGCRTSPRRPWPA